VNARLPFNTTDISCALPAIVVPNGIDNVSAGVSGGSFSGTLSNAAYHALGGHISCSGMKALLRSPAHYQAYLEDPDDDGVKPNMGTAAHCAVLEPHSYDDRYTVYEKRRAGAPWETFKELHSGKLILNRAEADNVMGMYHAVMNFRDFPLAKALSLGESEKSIFWTDRETGVKCRLRADSLNPCAILDLKTIDDARPEKVLRQVVRMDYDLQAAMYTEGVREFTGKTLPFVFVFVEDKKPHGVWLYTAGQSVIDNGMRKFRRGLEAVKRLQDTDDWHGYLGAMTTLELPRYAQLADTTGNGANYD